MKKLIVPLLVLLTLVGCSQKHFTPIINTEFQANAVYKMGDFSYSCTINKTADYVSVTPLTTNAKGMIIKSDSKNVTFKKDEMVKIIDKDKIDNTNPAVLLYSIFTYIESDDVDIKRVNNTFQYTGKTALGDFILVQNNDNSLVSISVPMANIFIEFES